MRPWIWLVALMLVLGCRAPMPWIKPANTRVAPPSTGVFGEGDQYYPGSAPIQPSGSSTPAGNPGTRAANRSVSSNDTDNRRADGETEPELAWTTRDRMRQRPSSDGQVDRYGATIRRASSHDSLDTGVMQADFEAPDLSYSPGSTRYGSQVEFNGMQINDAASTASAEVEMDDETTNTRSASWKAR